MALRSRQKLKKSGLKKSPKNSAEKFERGDAWLWPMPGVKLKTLATMKVVSVRGGVVTFKRIK